MWHSTSKTSKRQRAQRIPKTARFRHAVPRNNEFTGLSADDRMQGGHRHLRVEAHGRNFHRDFHPEPGPGELLGLGVFGGRYMTDCGAEFPEPWFQGAWLRSDARSPGLNFFLVDAPKPLAYWCQLEGLDPSRRRTPGPPLEGDDPARRPGPRPLRSGRSRVPPQAAPGAAALGPRLPQDLNRSGSAGGRSIFRAWRRQAEIPGNRESE